MNQTRYFDWDTIEEVLNELDWLARGADKVLLPDKTSRPLTTEERRGVQPARDAVLDALPDLPSDDPTTFPITLPDATWQLIDALCIGVDFGWGVGVVGRREAVR